MEDRLAAGWQKVKEGTNLETGEVVTEEEAAPAEETPAVEAAPAEVVPGAEETPDTPPADETTEEFALDDGEVVGPKQFNDWLTEHPEAKSALDASPELKNKVYGALRRDAENREIRQFIPDVETAKTVTQAAATFQNIDNKFLAAANDPAKGPVEFLNTWVQEALIIGDDGKPKVGADGKYEVHPSLPAIFNHIFSNKRDVLAKEVAATGQLPAEVTPFFDNLATYAESKGDERLQAALDILRERLAPGSQAEGEVPDALKPQAAALSERERKIAEQEQAHAREVRQQQEAAHTQSIERAETKAAESVKGQLKPLFAKSGLSEFEQQAALERIGEEVDAKLADNRLYQSIYDSILQQPASEEREKRLTKHMLTYTNEILGPVASKVIRDAKGGAVQRQADKQTRVETQKAVSRTDPRGASVSVAQPANLGPKETIAAIKAEHPDWDTSQVLTESWKRANAPKKA